jgi:N-acetylneuraminic acid mutarotase
MSAILHLLSAANFELKMQKRQKQWRAIKVFIGKADAFALPLDSKLATYLLIFVGQSPWTGD